MAVMFNRWDLLQESARGISRGAYATIRERDGVGADAVYKRNSRALKKCKLSMTRPEQ